MWDWLARWLPGPGLDRAELARRLDLDPEHLRRVEPEYHRFTIPKRNGQPRTILAPRPELKRLQRAVLRRLLGRLRAHPAAHGFERGHSIATHARHHAGQAVVIRLDATDFFAATRSRRVHAYFRSIGWNREAAQILTRLCTQDGGLPQGAPTSPRLSNLVNHRLDARLAGLATSLGAVYTRYADDLTFSFSKDLPGRVAQLTHIAADILIEEGPYRLNPSKTMVRRAHQQQRVTGLVVNDQVDLPRRTRRWLRAVEHHLTNGRPATLTPDQLQGWRALEEMVLVQGQPPG